MKVSKVFFGLAIVVSLAFVGCPMSDPSFELIIPPNPPFEGLPSGQVVVQRPGYEKYWPMGGYVEVEMTMSEGMITEVFIFLSHDDPFLAREIIEYWGFHQVNGPGWMVERNTVDLDIITGATATSIAVLDAAAAAVEYIRTNTQPVPTIILDREFFIMTPGANETLNARVTLLSVFDLVWSSSNQRVATVSNGIITGGTENGVAVITAADPDGRAAASAVVVLHGGTDPTPAPGHGLTQVRRVAFGGRFDPVLGNHHENVGNVYLVDNEGFLAMGKNITESNDQEDGFVSSWEVLQSGSDTGRFALRNVHTRRYLNVQGVTRGTSNDTFVSSQPRVSPDFVNDDSFFWVFLPVTGGGYNIVSYGTVRGAADAGNDRAGALSNKDFPQAYWPEANAVFWPHHPFYPVCHRFYGNNFLSEPCMVPYPFKLVQWRFDADDWETVLNHNAFVFDIIDE